MERSGKITSLPTEVTFYIDQDGKVTVTCLYADLLPVAFSLNPEDKQIKEFISHQIKIGKRNEEI